jgi:S-disulfanyl-L-cysteine oxidoreductase SoxD
MTPAIRWGLGASAAVVAVAAGVALWLAIDGGRISADPDDATLVARGKASYAQHCASCHGADLEGQPNWRQPLPNGRWPAAPHDAGGHTWHHSDEVLFRVTKFGMGALVHDRDSDMPAFDGVLGDADIWAVLSYIESTWPPDIRARQQRLNRPSR